MHHVLLDTTFIIGVTFLYGVRSIVGKWMVLTTWKLSKKFLVKTQDDAALWLHHYNRKHNRGHSLRGPVECEDGACAKI